MTPEAYIIAWLIYLVGAVGLLVVVWRFTTNMRAAIGEPLRVIAAVVLLFPYSIGEGYSEWAPAFLMLSLEALFAGGDAALRVGVPLLLAMVVALLLSALLAWHWQRRSRHSAAEQALVAERDALLNESQQQAAAE